MPCAGARDTNEHGPQVHATHMDILRDVQMDGPQFAGYEAATERMIPVIVLDPVN